MFANLSENTRVVFKYGGQGMCGWISSPPIQYESEATQYIVMIPDAGGSEGSHAPAYVRVPVDRIVGVFPGI